MKREDVYKLIDGEREYQDAHHQLILEQCRDGEHSIADWTIYVEVHLMKAKYYIYDFKYGAALEEIRKIAALCVACMEHNETKSRPL